MYVMHTLIVTCGDFYYYRLAKDVGGRECAVVTTIFSLTHEYALRYHSRTCANSVETTLCIVGLFYYNRLWKVKMFCPDLTKMTLVITVCFLIRSSSLAGWVPLALLKLCEHPSNFLPVLMAGLTVALPCILASVAIDSWYYGVVTVPQFNFVYFNVLENLSVYFGIDPWFAYLHGFKDQYGNFFVLAIFGLSWVSVVQIQGQAAKSRIPSFFVFTAASLTVLSTVDHKELRFLSPLVQLGCLSEGFVLAQGFKIKPLRLLVKWTVIVVMFMGAAVGYIYATRAYMGIYYSHMEAQLTFRAEGLKVTE
eukprot:CAMPEP_0170499278 /NCGR_PEP_ID=MMETSP0208-20121228/30828_1 /TAXON_ID=197538 /ORGANISM="Strombidium inclinatum, Strain S3" /LENGTH=307 /DNA_ID=CAMNT_0010776769 /DNA_START=284 /DNA_END=1207 /DNA_ORIENTATION=+